MIVDPGTVRARRVMSRWARSPLTFGPAGRILATLVVIAPVAVVIFVNVFFLVAAAIWLFVLPAILRDIWRPGVVAVVEDELPARDDPADRPKHQSITGPPAPGRW